jgi:hypothetical protein
MIVILGCAIDSQTVPRIGDPPAQPGAEEDVKRLIDGGQGQGRIVLPEPLKELLRRRMVLVLLQCGQDQHPGSCRLETGLMQALDSVSHHESS